MKYEIGDTIKFGNSGYEVEGVIIKARPPQPTYDIKGSTVDGSVRVGIEEDRLELVKKRPVPCKHLIVRIDRNCELVAFNDFCPLCGEDIRYLHER